MEMAIFVYLFMRSLSLPLLLLLLLSPLWAWGTHNRAGEIIICHIGTSQSDLLYRVTIITHTKTSAPADRPELVLEWGDGVIDTLPRVSITPIPGADAQRNEYVGEHRYSGPGVYTLQMDDQNRNGGVLNVPNSIGQSFCIKTQLVIGAATGNNCSVRFLKPPLQDACINQPWIHNPVAFDPDGDSLSYEPAVCLGLECVPIQGYSFPTPNYSIDPITGTISWLNPTVAGEYNIAFIVREWRRVNGVMQQVGWVMRDMQITVRPCSNQPPQIQQVADTCVEAGTFLSFPVNASDPDPFQTVTLTALGQPFVVNSSPAVFLSPSPGNSVTGVFSWNTNCSHVRTQPYQVVFNAADNHPQTPLQMVSTMSIRIVGPAPQDPQAVPVGSSIELSWQQSICSNVTGYRIYRRNGLYGFTPSHCETGVPPYTGYQFIGSTTGLGNTSYVDDDGLVFGNEYCYMVVAVFPDGAQSYASVEFCALLDRQVPLMTHVSVGITDVTTGEDTIRWTNAYDLDTIARPGPYQFRLYRGTGATVANDLLWVSPLSEFLAHPDTAYLDEGLNTQDLQHVYRVELYGDAGETLIGSSNPASSIFLRFEPDDEQLTLIFDHNTPWSNYFYEVYRLDGGEFVLIGTTDTDSYTDTGLENGATYCYYAKAFGQYSDPAITAPLINFSQEACGVPEDRTPPCPPELALDNDCELPLNTLAWTNPNAVCDETDDTERYHVYFTSSPEEPYSLIMTIIGAEVTLFEHVFGSSVAGCYYVTAIDTVGNESEPSNIVCGDNCPEYSLPNIFTPNRDGVNDFFIPFPYRGVEKVDMQVFNRWGQLVYRSEDPALGWDGTLLDSGEPVPDGVYYYTCLVTYIRLEGTEPVQHKGYVHLLRSDRGNVN